MSKAKIKVITEKEYKDGLKNEIRQYGLVDSVEKRCDEINDLCHYMRYITHRSIQELLVEILDLARVVENEGIARTEDESAR